MKAENNSNNKWFFLLNPTAGSGKAGKKWNEIEKKLNKNSVDFICEKTKFPNNSKEIIEKAIKNRFRKFMAIGGDGTLNDLVNGIFLQNEIKSNEIIIGIIPMGSGNDWVRTHYNKQNIDELIKTLKKEQIILHDVGLIKYKASKKYFINMAGFGFDAEVLKRANEIKNRGFFKGALAYTIALVLRLFKYKTVNAKIEIDEKIIGLELFNLDIGICKYAGGGMQLTPHAIFDDGKLAVTIVKKINRFKIIRNYFKLFSGKYIENKEIKTFQAEKIKVESKPKIFAQADGELLSKGNYEISMLPQSIQVLS